MKELIHFVALQWKYQLKLKTILKNLYSFTNAVKIKIVMTATTQQDTKVMTFANSLLVTNKIYLNWITAIFASASHKVQNIFLLFCAMIFSFFKKTCST